MDRIEYKGYVITAEPMLQDGSWSIKFQIEEHTDGEIIFSNHSATNTYKTREEAVGHCHNAGRLEIDGGGPKRS